MKLRWLVLLVVALPAFAADEMRKLDWWLGEWSGPASIQMGPGKPQQVLQTERVQSKLGGRVILVEGLGKRRMEDGSAGEVAHEALAVVSYDEKTKKYVFDAWTARDGHVDAWLEVGEKQSATWGFDTPQGGKIRYSIRLTEAGEWNEIGEFSRDGNQWMKFFEMTLAKK
jgi:hypothetical protein